jgi:vacuolar protein sorting-associated protein VTA1
MTYTTDLMDKLEKLKTAHGDDPSITDDAAARVYVEQFALETFQRADNSINSNTVTA